MPVGAPVNASGLPTTRRRPNNHTIPIHLYITFQILHLSYSIPWSTGFRCSDFCWRAVEPHGCSGGGITVVPEPNGHVLIVCPWASRVAMRAHNRKIRFSPWRYLNLLDLYSLETLAEWTGKAAVLISLCGLICSCDAPVNSWICIFALPNVAYAFVRLCAMALPSRHTRNCVRASVMAIARLRNLALILYKSAHLASRLRFCLGSYYNPIASTMLSEIDCGSDRRPGFERNGCASVPLLPSPTFSTTLAAFGASLRRAK